MESKSESACNGRALGLTLEGGNMPTHRSTNRFNERELARALRAANKSGTPIDRVDVDPATGRISVIIARPGGEPPATAVREWHKATEDLQRRKSKDK
jgi:hypothetical protein